jgi:hypothetical protein
MLSYKSDWVPDSKEDLDAKMEDLAKAGHRIISVVYRPHHVVDWGPPKKPHTQVAQFVIISEVDDAKRT